jgi:probable F420-dependent oxidoreductase
MKPFRFSIEISKLPSKTWRDDLKFIEDVGYSSILWTDHFGPQWEPTTAMASTAAVTTKLKTGTMVYCVDFHHPVVLAKASATAQLLSNGRIEFGIGAGWLKADYNQAGIPYDKPSTRIRRMEEAIKIIKSMWWGKTTFKGKHYQIDNIFKAANLDNLSPPPILVGGGGKMLLGVAGRHADIVNVMTGLPEGRFTGDFYRRGVHDGYVRRIGYVREAAEKAGRDFEDIELSLALSHSEITDDPDSVIEYQAKRRGITVDVIKNNPSFMIGSVDEVKESLYASREETGIDYIVLGLPSVEEIRQFGKHIVKDLTGK